MKMRKLLLSLSLLLTVSLTMGAELDIKAFLKLAKSGSVYPTAEQISMLEGLVPADTYLPFPTIEDRAYWDAIAQSEDGKRLIAEANVMLTQGPEVPISDDIYRRANLEGNRGIYKPRYYATMERLENFMLAECAENEGRYLLQIEEHIRAILAMKSWVHPNHDDGENGVLEGRRVTIDLSARKFCFVLSLADLVLLDRIPAELSAEIREKVRYRVIDSYLNSCRGITPGDNKWIYSANNWNSVCTSGTLLTILTSVQNRDERVAAIGCAINSMVYYLAGFGEDGYCSEGLGYWNYGFGHYLYLAEIVYDYSDGAIDMFKFDNPEKMVAVANFPAQYEIHKSTYAPFSDGVTSVADGSDNYAYLAAAKHYGARKPSYYVPCESVLRVLGWRDAEEFTAPAGSQPLPSSTYFDDCGIIISRGTQQRPLSVAVKSGHNAENHNHNDVGSYFIMLDKDIVAGDIGAPSYVAGAFSADNPARSSWGHPVPRIDGKLQSTGAQFKGEVTKTKFKEETDWVKINLIKAYEIAELKSLERTVENVREGRGEIVVTDSFTASKPISFGTAVMVNVKYKIEGQKITLYTGENEVDVIVESTGGEVVIRDEVVPVKSLRSGRTSYRIGIDFVNPQSKGTITVRYMPR